MLWNLMNQELIFYHKKYLQVIICTLSDFMNQRIKRKVALIKMYDSVRTGTD